MTPRRRRPGAALLRAAAPLLATALAACLSTSPPNTNTGVELGKAFVEISGAATANGPLLVAGPDGSVHAFWSDQNVVRRKVSTDGGQTFGPEEVVLDAGPLGNVTVGAQQPRPLAAVIDDAGETHLLVQVSHPTLAQRTDIYYTHPERYAVPVEKALVTGGRDLSGQGLFTSAAYDPRTRQWEPVNRAALGLGLYCDAGTPVPADAGKRWDHATAAHGGRIYTAGGEDISGPLDRVAYFDPDRGAWLREMPLPGPRTGHVLVDDGTYLYALGGRDGTAALGSIVRLDPSAGIAYSFDTDGTALGCTVPGATPWVTLGATLGVGRVHPAAALVHRLSGDLELYVIGGETFAGTPLESVAAFRVEPGGFLTPLPAPPSLPGPRSGHTAVAVGERIYVMGGTSDGTDTLDQTLVLDLAAPSPAWLAVAPMPAPRRDHVAAVLEGEVYLMAGADADGPTGRVDVLDPATETWRTDPESSAPVLPLGAAAAVFSEASLPRNLSRQAADASQPGLARDPVTGDIYAVWRNEAPVDVPEGEAPRTTADVYLTRSTDNGDSFSAVPVRLSALGDLASRNNNFSGEPRLAVAPNGLIHLAWIETGETGSFDQGGQEVIYTNCAPDDTVANGIDCGDTLLVFPAVGGTGPGAAPAGQMANPAVAVDDAGTAYLAWVDVHGTVPISQGSATEILALNVYFTQRRGIGTFTTPRALGEDVLGRVLDLFPPGTIDDPVALAAQLASRVNSPTLAAWGDGDVTVVWGNDSEVRLRRSQNGGLSFLMETSVAPLVSGAQRVQPQVVRQPVTGDLVALWQTLTASTIGPMGGVDSVVETRTIAPLD